FRDAAGLAAELGPQCLIVEYFEVDGAFAAIALRGTQACILPDLGRAEEIHELLRQLRLGVAGEVASTALREKQLQGPEPGVAGQLDAELGRLYEPLLLP